MNSIDPHGLGQYISPAGLLSAFLAVCGAIPVIVGTLGGTVALIYYCVQLWETQTVQSFISGTRARRLARKVAFLEYQQSEIVGKLKQLGVLTHAATDVKQGDMRKTTTTIETSTQPVQDASRNS